MRRLALVLVAVATLSGGCASSSTARGAKTAREAEEDRVDPEVRALLAGLDKPRLRGAAPITAEESARRDRARWASLQPFAARRVEVAGVEEARAEGRHGPVPLRIFRPTAGGDRLPLVVYLHGGEYTAGSLDLFDSTCRALAQGSGAVVVAAGYRLAPEAAFPAPLDDAGFAVRWAFAHAADLGVDPARVALAGDDAGAALAVAQAVEHQRSVGPPLRALALAYPLADARMESASWREFGALPYLLTPEDLDLALDLYLRGTSREDPRVSPVLLDDSALARLPRSLILTAELDPARDDGERLAARIRAAGGAAEVRRTPGMVHGFLLFAGAVEPAGRALAGLAAWLRTALEPERR